ncbi:hypothetical protein CF65_01129 [Aggregatibacter actinomycetemcomitans HK1651]|nr:hypothetical protein CF65_01129 [Aggregatibacter actinomycetemcomitans HK1651]
MIDKLLEVTNLNKKAALFNTVAEFMCIDFNYL